MKNNFYIIPFFTLLPDISFAVCPLCTIAVGTGIGLSHWIGIDDVISGLWIGGFIMSMIIWTIDWLNRKNIKFKGRKILTVSIYYFAIIFPIYQSEILAHPLNTLFGVNKLLLGIIIGSFAFLSGYIVYSVIKQHKGRAHFPFEKAVLSIVPLILLTIVFIFILKIF